MATLIGILFLIAFVSVLWTPAWWLAGIIESDSKSSLLRLPVSVALALVGYLTFVNLTGRLLEDSLYTIIVYLLINGALTVLFFLKRQANFEFGAIFEKWKSWLPIVLLTFTLAIPQIFHAVSGNRWDEMASSSIHVTAPNQFAEGVFPPRHNAFPDIVVKYHYGFTLLSGGVRWVTGFPSAASIDIASTALWLFSFVFAYGWIRSLRMSKTASIWGGFSILLGGGLSWAYLHRLRIYDGYQKLPGENRLIHSYDSEMSWWNNLLKVTEQQNIHLSNKAGEIFPLPFDVSIHYQQHAVALGIALTLVAAYVFWTWQRKPTFSLLLLVLNVATFGLVFLGHAVFGAMAAASAGLTLAILWVKNPSWSRLTQGIIFTLGVTFFAFAHGGMLTPGEDYGPPGAPVEFRNALGYLQAGVMDQINWSLAGFGFLLLFSLVTLALWIRKRNLPSETNIFLIFFGLFALVSFLVPQVAFFSHAGGVEEQTEISKFFFCTHLGLALFSVMAVDVLSRKFTSLAIFPFFIMTAVSPVAASISASLDESGKWSGIYRSPYAWQGGTLWRESGEALESIKSGSRDQYYDFSTQEATSGYLNELLVYGGSVFSLTPTRYEITGFGFLVSEDKVAHRIIQEGRMARFYPGVAESSGTDWLYGSEERDLTNRPTIVRSRFQKMHAEEMLAKKWSNRMFELHKLTGLTDDLDQSIEMHWKPRIVFPANTDWDGDGRLDPVFYNHHEKSITVDGINISIANMLESENSFPMFFLGRSDGHHASTLYLGQMSDAKYSRGATVSQMVRRYAFTWRRLNTGTGNWSRSFQQGFWMLPAEIPFVSDRTGDGSTELLTYRPKSSMWLTNGRRKFSGPSINEARAPIPFMGRFFTAEGGDPGLWSPLNGKLIIESRKSEDKITLDWGGKQGDVLLPGDYDGDGLDELAIWQAETNKWWIRKLPSGPNRGVEFGSPTGIPVPSDYNGDGILDLAYWEPGEHKIFISFSSGESIDKTIDVPEHSIPIFVNMY